jgi:hypothetical protein
MPALHKESSCEGIEEPAAFRECSKGLDIASLPPCGESNLLTLTFSCAAEYASVTVENMASEPDLQLLIEAGLEMKGPVPGRCRLVGRDSRFFSSGMSILKPLVRR